MLRAAATVLLAIAIAGCGSGNRAPASPDRATLKQIDGTLSALTRLQGQINLAPRVSARAPYVRVNGPLIVQFDQRARQLGSEITALRAAAAAQIYAPLGDAIAVQAGDMRRFLSAVLAGDRGRVGRLYARVNRDELEANRVAVRQFPKARAYAVKLAGAG